MDDGGKQPHTFGNGQQRTHPRPFFYVQPPSQPQPPYYLYQQWQMNNPYSQYGLPAGFNYGRPYMPPYQYMQYPGYVFPQAPVYPVDYRRMYEPRFHAPPWGQQQQQQHHHPQPYGRREMACSEAQTDPSDAITKLIECLDKIRANELAQGAARELDSGVGSQSSGMFSPGEENKKREEQGHVLPSVSDDSRLECHGVAFSDSTTAVYDGESSHRSLDVLSPQGCWSGALEEEEEELPLDSSSVHEDCPAPEQSASDQRLVDEVTDIQSDIFSADPSVSKRDAAEPLRSTPAPSFSCGQPVLRGATISDNISKTEHHTDSVDGAESEPSFQILKLPFESILTPGAAGGGGGAGGGGPYFYNYLSMQTTHERMSVLSPSLDELSSRDEMFSTDLDDVDLFPKTVYAGRRLAGVAPASPQAAEEVDEVWLPGSKRFMCACCGKNVAKGSGRSKVQSSKTYRDEAGDSEEESRYGGVCEQPVRVVVRKHCAPRKTHPVPPRHAGKPWYKRGHFKDPSEPFDQGQSHILCKQEAADGKIRDVAGSELHCRTCTDRVCRDDLGTSDQTRWGESDVIPRRRPATPLQQRQEMSTQRKATYHRPRDEDNDDDEPPPLRWERGSTIRGEPRC